MTTDKNLDSQINEYSYKMVKEIFKKKKSLNIIDKALGVLTNDGVYGYYVYCKAQSQGKNENDRVESPEFNIFVSGIVSEFRNLFNISIDNECNNFDKYDKYFSELSKDIHKLLFFKDILERILTYARYHTKAYGDDNE